MPDPLVLTPQSAFRGFLPESASGRAGVMVEELGHLQLATVIARTDAVAAAVRNRYGIDLAAAPRCFAGRTVSFLGIGPRTWLAQREGGGPLAEELAEVLQGCAAVADQSDGYAVLRISGSRARETFEKGLSVDLHPRAFKVDDVAVTICAHIGVIIRQVDDTPAYDVAMFRSYAGSFCHWLTSSAAAFGLAVRSDVRG
jgi:sarcosine oxidase subunit gamma